MRYVWNTPHADRDRLRERSSFTVKEVEERLAEERYVVQVPYYGQKQTQHLIWDPGRNHLIAVPVVPQADGTSYIPTILPVNYASRLAEWLQAEAEQTWLGENYLLGAPYGPSVFEGEEAEVWLAKNWRATSSSFGNTTWKHKPRWKLSDVKRILVWPVFGPENKFGEAGLLALFRNREFRETMRELLEDMEPQLYRLCGGGDPIVHLKHPGAHRHIPLKFFLDI